MTRYTLSWPWSARVYSASLCGRRSRVRVRWLVPSPWRPCPCPAPPAARRLSTARSAELRCQAALPCLLSSSCSFQPFFSFLDAPKGHGFGIGLLLPCPVSYTACLFRFRVAAPFFFFLFVVSDQMGPVGLDPNRSGHHFPAVGATISRAPTGTTEDRQTPPTSARVVTVPFLHNNPVRAAFLKPFSAN